ncbi:MAG: peptidoglycan DD-metalloendopeptidase family protein [Nitrospirota bacterium]
MLARLKEKYDLLRKEASARKKEYFTVVILPGPNSKVRKFSISKSLLRNSLIAAVVLVMLSTGMFGQYLNMASKVIELDSLRREASSQRAQLMQIAASVVDMKSRMARIKEMSDRLSSVAGNVAGKSFGVKGTGGSSELGAISLQEFGSKNRSEAAAQVSQELQGLKSDASSEEARIKKLMSYFEQRNSIMACTPSIWPVRGFITSDFGYRHSPIYGTTEFHCGLDIANATGTPVHATADGTVSASGISSSYGRYVKIQHGYGLATMYCHLSRMDVHEGQRVKKGDIIGAVGDTGHSTGPHLHYEVLVNGVPVNPMKYI